MRRDAEEKRRRGEEMQRRRKKERREKRMITTKHLAANTYGRREVKRFSSLLFSSELFSLLFRVPRIQTIRSKQK